MLLLPLRIVVSPKLGIIERPSDHAHTFSIFPADDQVPLLILPPHLQ